MAAPIPFRRSELLTLGAEWELQLLDRKRLDLSNKILHLLKAFPEANWVKPEFIQSCVEITSPVCSDADQLYQSLKAVLSRLRERAGALGLRLCGGGTHPFCRRLALITPLPRYLQQKRRYGLLARSQITFATHIHLGLPDGETAIRLMRRLRRFLPLLVGLSAASPFWRGYETGFASYRLRILAAGRSYGLPPDFESYEAFCRFFELARRTHMFETFRDPHWDLRPHPDFGTLEVRIMDSQLTLEEVVALATFLQTLAGELLEREPPLSPLPWWLEKENLFQASRGGLLARAVTASGRVYLLGELFSETLARLKARADPVQKRWLSWLEKRVEEGVGWQRLLRAWRRKGDLRRVVLEVSEQLSGGGS